MIDTLVANIPTAQKGLRLLFSDLLFVCFWAGELASKCPKDYCKNVHFE